MENPVKTAMIFPIFDSSLNERIMTVRSYIQVEPNFFEYPLKHNHHYFNGRILSASSTIPEPCNRMIWE
jgi:hypothetical protein